MTDDEFVLQLSNLERRLTIYIRQHTDPENPWDSDTPTLMLDDLQTVRREVRLLHVWAQRALQEAQEEGGPNGPPESPAESPNLSML